MLRCSQPARLPFPQGRAIASPSADAANARASPHLALPLRFPSGSLSSSPSSTQASHPRISLLSTFKSGEPLKDPASSSPRNPGALASTSSIKRTAKASASHDVAGDASEDNSAIGKKVIQTICTGVAFLLAALVQSGAAIAGTPIRFPAGNDATAIAAASSGRDLLVSAWMGLMAGCLHTLTGPDHLAALAPLSIGRTKLESVAVGALWGCGHDAGQVIFGLLFLLLKDKLHIEVLRTWGARVVAMTLITIGVIGIKEAQEVPVPCVAGTGAPFTNVMPRTESFGNAKAKLSLATFATGIVHGLQPDALLMILPALALPSRFAGAAFLSMFLFGTVLAMSGYTAFIGSCSSALKKRIPRINEHLSVVSSLIAIFVGAGMFAGEFFGLSIF